jgi:hypothetical protein
MSCVYPVQCSNPSLFQKSSPNSQHDTTAPRSPAITDRPKKPTPTRSPYLMKVRRNAMGEKKFLTRRRRSPHLIKVRRNAIPGSLFLRAATSRSNSTARFLRLCGLVRVGRAALPNQGACPQRPPPPCLAVPFGLDKDRQSIPPGRFVTHCSFEAQTGLRSVSRDVYLSMPLLSNRIKLLL